MSCIRNKKGIRVDLGFLVPKNIVERIHDEDMSSTRPKRRYDASAQAI